MLSKLVLRLLPVALVAPLCACRSVPQRQYFPAKGSEVWIERHLRSQRAADGRSTLEVRFVPDTSGQRQGYHPQATLLVSDEGTSNLGGSLRHSITEKTPVRIPLMPGSHRLTVLALTYERVSHTVDLAADDSVVISVRLPGAAYCEETVTVMSGMTLARSTPRASLRRQVGDNRRARIQ
jgi:hypothetical protein